MRLIVEYFWDVPYSASGTETFGVEYESKEQFLFDLELYIEENYKKQKYYEFNFAGFTMEWSQVVIEWLGGKYPFNYQQCLLLMNGSKKK